MSASFVTAFCAVILACAVTGAAVLFVRDMQRALRGADGMSDEDRRRYLDRAWARLERDRSIARNAADHAKARRRYAKARARIGA